MWLVQSELCAATISADRAIDAREFFDGDGVFDVAEPGAAVILREDDAQQAEFGQLGNQFGGKREASSHSMTCGAISDCAKSRTVRWSCCCSSVREKSTLGLGKPIYRAILVSHGWMRGGRRADERVNERAFLKRNTRRDRHAAFSARQTDALAKQMRDSSTPWHDIPRRDLGNNVAPLRSE